MGYNSAVLNSCNSSPFDFSKPGDTATSDQAKDCFVVVASCQGRWWLAIQAEYREKFIEASIDIMNMLPNKNPKAHRNLFAGGSMGERVENLIGVLKEIKIPMNDVVFNAYGDLGDIDLDDASPFDSTNGVLGRAGKTVAKEQSSKFCRVLADAIQRNESLIWADFR